MKVKAAVLRKYGAPMDIEELELAEPREKEVQVKMLACGVCHSDISLWEGYITQDIPMVPGHEACARVEKVGPGVSKLKPGDRVIGCWMVPCGYCFQCRRGRPNLCETSAKFFQEGNLLDGTSRLTDRNGKRVGMGSFVTGFATHTVMPEIAAIRVPDHIQLPEEQLCQLGCSVATGWGSIVNVANAREGSTVAVWGCGGIGLNAIRVASLRNCSLVIAVDLESSKRNIALEFGATHFIDSSQNDPIPIIKDLTGGAGLDFAVEATGDPGAQTQSWWSIRSGGSIIAVGISPIQSTTAIPLFYAPLHAKAIRGTLYGETHPTEDLPSLMEVMNSGQLKTDKLVTRLIRLEDLPEARQAIKDRKVIGRWVIKYD
ncbi:MAG: Alcohol dehydrogenase zinc-binding domain protein [Chloroflexi bacterium]|jgi:S-(hydroxymethyl)glutathione dehydrogenase/alcohol dehydrogenase|nr:Alcohol dehydrogenase zinc-binding domain protein [Chloroflexota bacterium]